MCIINILYTQTQTHTLSCTPVTSPLYYTNCLCFRHSGSDAESAREGAESAPGSPMEEGPPPPAQQSDNETD